MDVNETIKHYTQTQIKIQEQLAARKNMDVNEHETIKHYTQAQIKVQEQLAARKNMDVNEHERLSNITRRHKLKYRNSLQ